MMIVSSLAQTVNPDNLFACSQPYQQQGNTPDADLAQICKPYRLMANVYLVLPQSTLYGEIAPGWRLRKPLIVTEELVGESQYIVADDVFLVYGTGKNASEARQDYIKSLLEYSELLARHDDEETQTLLQQLQTYLVMGQ